MVRMLGRPRRGERLSAQERAALERLVEPEPGVSVPAKAPAPGDGSVHLPKKALAWRWTANCPRCQTKIGGQGSPRPGQRLTRCGSCKAVIFLEGG